MQTNIQARNAGLGREAVRLLLKLYSKGEIQIEEGRWITGLDETGYNTLLDSLQGEYLVDVVSHSDGSKLVEILSLTERGRKLVPFMIENMFEIPE